MFIIGLLLMKYFGFKKILAGGIALLKFNLFPPQLTTTKLPLTNSLTRSNRSPNPNLPFPKLSMPSQPTHNYNHYDTTYHTIQHNNGLHYHKKTDAK